MSVSSMLLWLAVQGLRAEAAEVVVSGTRWESLQPVPVPVVPPDPFVHGANVVLRREGSGVAFRATYRVHVPARASWVALPVAPADAHLTEVTLDGQTVPTTLGSRGLSAVIRPQRDGVLTVVGHVDRDWGADLGLMRVPGIVRVADRGLTVPGSVDRGDGTRWIGGGPLALVEVPRARQGGQDLVLGDVAVGVTVGDTVVRKQARLRWRIARGTLRQVTFSLPEAGADLTVVGPQVASWERQGRTITVTLKEPERALVSVEVRWTDRLPDGDEATVRAPQAVLNGTFRTTRALQIAREGTHEVVPSVDGYQPIPSSALPAWARGLVEGRATATYLAQGGGTAAIQVLRVAPAQGPPTVIDVASHRVATSREGRLLMRAHYAVRNDRGPHLRLIAPEGTRVVAARVAGETAEIARDGEAVLIPLARSVETLQGLLTFPVEVTLLGEADAWSQRGDHAVPLPVVDAPIAVSRTTVFLPPELRATRKPASSRIVTSFSEGEGITYGFASGDVRAAQADEMFQGAVSAWMSNDFEAAQSQLDDLRALGADNEDVQRLQSNLSYVLEGSAAGADVTQARRVKEMARARAEAEVVEQERVLREAEEEFAAGNYDVAEQRYSRALELGGKLEKLAADEDTEVQAQNQDVSKKLDLTREYRARTEVDFDEADVSGELVTPQGQLVLDRRASPPPPPPPAPVVRPPLDAPRVVEVQGLPAALGGTVAAKKKRPRFRSRSERRGPTTGAPAPAAPPPLEVTATSASVVIPELGEAVLYQRLLLPAGAPDAVPCSVRPRRKR